MKPSPDEKPSRQAAWRKKNPKAYWAHSATASAIRRGLIARQPCEVCGAAKTDAHHPDYERPLLVQWLCRKHHTQAHAKMRQSASE
jgi:hypothetical protein